MHTYDVIVTMSQVGPDRLMRPHDLITIMQDCSNQWLQTEPAMLDYLRNNNMAMVVTSRQMDVLRYPAYDERLQVRTSVFACKGYLGYRNTCVYDEAGEPVALSWSKGAWIDRATAKLQRVPAKIAESLVYDPEVPMEKLSKKVKVPECEPGRPEPWRVRPSHTDLYGHMNNAQYVRLAWDLLPEDFDVHRVRVEYKLQARPGDLMVPALYRPDDGRCVVTLSAEDGTLFCPIEFE